LFLCLTENNAMKTYWGSGGIAPRILDLWTKRRWVVSFTPRPIYQRGKNPISTGKEAGWAPKSVWTRWWREKFPAPAGTGTPIVQLKNSYTSTVSILFTKKRNINCSCKSNGGPYRSMLYYFYTQTYLLYQIIKFAHHKLYLGERIMCNKLSNWSE
jgi:hypothetical protein